MTTQDNINHHRRAMTATIVDGVAVCVHGKPTEGACVECGIPETKPCQHGFGANCVYCAQAVGTEESSAFAKWQRENLLALIQGFTDAEVAEACEVLEEAGVGTVGSV